METLSPDLQHRISVLHREKHRVYGDAWKRRGEVLGILANLARKVDRLKSLPNLPQGTPDETWQDTAIDLLVYALKHQTYLADHDARIRQQLFPTDPPASPISDATAGFDVLLSQLEPVQQPSIEELVKAIERQFQALEQCYRHLEARSSAVKRLEENQKLARLAGGLVEALTEPARHSIPSLLATPLESSMSEADYAKLRDDALQETGTIAILGATTTAQRLVKDFVAANRTAPTIFDPQPTKDAKPIEDLPAGCDVIVVAHDREKHALLAAARPFIQGQPKIIVSGYAHYEFQDPIFQQTVAGLRIPSLANGYPNSLIHLYQCLANAARLNLDGVVAEFGVFQGGTTMFLAKAIQALGRKWPIYGFDTFSGFPPRRHALDMYDHKDLYATDLQSVTKYLQGHNVHLVPGDIVDTAKTLRGKPVVLTFMDTDNYSPAMAALNVVQETTVRGGAIVFDHYTGTNRFRQTLGERLAAIDRLLDDRRYFNLHGTGVFLRQA